MDITELKENGFVEMISSWADADDWYASVSGVGIFQVYDKVDFENDLNKAIEVIAVSLKFKNVL